uniref:Uncharacterized protein LOC105050662 n=1 Tax=Elaeis guineensis var. tenera TaxID=51953 RepID=A0A6I9RVV1_ELAGV|nr:uncharacterized protein LOC105050662 [Elaeis guineensis]
MHIARVLFVLFHLILWSLNGCTSPFEPSSSSSSPGLRSKRGGRNLPLVGRRRALMRDMFLFLSRIFLTPPPLGAGRQSEVCNQGCVRLQLGDTCTPTGSVTTCGPSYYKMQHSRMRNVRNELGE